ncbi:hypothetical protein A3K63_02470 [Candidatus Micrarchaeota archaeon RBG_16_49_10]|nr:MAG: hypothetical protein A3K63_02470 [Candidatus Micrarchaeota archaeon RBG_16_49_10]
MDGDFMNKIKKKIEKLHEENNLEWYYKYHILVVEKIADDLNKEFGGDTKIIKLSALLHDIGKVFNKEPHNIEGAKIAEDFLEKEGIQKEVIKHVSECVKSHNCFDIIPKTIEAKIISTADALSHFNSPLFFAEFLFENKEKDFGKLIEIYQKTIEKDYKKKIQFDKIKKKYFPEYKLFKKMFLIES